MQLVNCLFGSVQGKSMEKQRQAGRKRSPRKMCPTILMVEGTVMVRFPPKMYPETKQVVLMSSSLTTHTKHVIDCIFLPAIQVSNL